MHNAYIFVFKGETEPTPKVSFFTKIGDLGCGAAKHCVFACILRATLDRRCSTGIGTRELMENFEEILL
jgi:hypothetical protein